MSVAYPSQDEVSRAVAAASAALGLDPLMVGSPGAKMVFGVPRARTYAALALTRLFPQVGVTRLASLVGGGKNILHKFYAERARGRATWFDEAVLRRVLIAVGTPPAQLSLALGPPVKAEARWPVPTQTPEQAFSFALGRPVAVPSPSKDDPATSPRPRVATPPAAFSAGAHLPVVTEVGPRRQQAVATAGFGNVTEEFFHDPAPERSALAEAQPWVPYEERAKKTRAWRSLTCSQPPRYETDPQ